MPSILSNSAQLMGRHALERATRAVNRNLEHLATGKRINRASDDPAGSISVTNLKGSERELQGKIDSLLQEDSYLGAREGAQSVISDLLVDLQGLIVTGANRDALSDDEKRGIQLQADSILQTIDHLANTSRFKNQQILQGFNTTSLGAGSRTRTLADGSTVTDSYRLADLARGGRLNLIDGDAEAAQQAVEIAASSVSASRAAVGARSNSVESEVRSLQSQLEQTSAARSAIEDTDFAKETAELVRNQVLQQAAMFVTQLATEQVRALTANLLKTSS